MDLATQSRSALQGYAAFPPDRVILFMGAPGSGKGTQSAILAASLGISAISTGEILREAAKAPDSQGQRLREIMATGRLVDDATVCDVVASRIRGMQTGSGGLILDGFPRTVAQARKLDRVLQNLGMPRPLVVHLDVPSDVILERISRRRQCAECGAILTVASDIGAPERCDLDGGTLLRREDDNEAVVLKRLSAYEAETMPVLDYYRTRRESNADYRRIDGCLSAAEIARGVCEIASFAGAPLAA